MTRVRATRASSEAASRASPSSARARWASWFLTMYSATRRREGSARGLKQGSDVALLVHERGSSRPSESMVEQVVRAVSLPVRVKTRIGWGPEDQMPIVELASRLEQVGVRTVTVHRSAAEMGYTGAASTMLERDAIEPPRVFDGWLERISSLEAHMVNSRSRGLFAGGNTWHPPVAGNQ